MEGEEVSRSVRRHGKHRGKMLLERMINTGGENWERLQRGFLRASEYLL